MQPDFVQQALKALRPDTPNWYGWAKFDADGNKIPNDQRMCWEHAIVIQDGVTKPTKEEFDAVYNELVSADPMRLLRAERNQRLANTDWWASSDLTMTAEQTAYRQALRDITETYTSLDDVVWPEVPQV